MHAPRLIKDPIHGYVYISDLEHRIINDPAFLRLQFISQQGLAYLTYPSNRTSRYSHSLGCMHIGSRLTKTLLRSDGDLLVAGVREHVLDSYLRHRSADLEGIRDYLAKHFDPFYEHEGFRPAQVVEIILLQSIRIACLVHDIGHFPFSHALEGVMISHMSSLEGNEQLGSFISTYKNLIRKDVQWKTDQANKKLLETHGITGGKLHELMGRLLTEDLFLRVLKNNEERQFGETCLNLGLEISRASKTPKSNDKEKWLSCLQELISGPVDADRLDYIERDSASSGLEFGRFDRDRIVSSMRLYQNSTEKKFRPTTIALSAVEAFFLERYRNQRWLVFHHNVARGDVAVARCLDILLSVWFGTSEICDPIREQIMKSLKKFKVERLWIPFSEEKNTNEGLGGQNHRSDGESRKEFLRCDESWLQELWKELYYVLSEEANKDEPLQLLTLRVCLGMVCQREKSRFVSLWKRIEEYRIFAQTFQHSSQRKMFDKWFEKAPGLSNLRKDSSQAIKFFNQIITASLKSRMKQYGSLLPLKELEKSVSSTTGGIILFHFSSFKPTSPFELVDLKGKGLIPMQELSALWGQLNEIWLNDIRLHAFFIPCKKNERQTVGTLNDDHPTKEHIQLLGKSLADSLYRLELNWDPKNSSGL